MSATAPTIFDKLAQQETQRMQHDQAATQGTGNAENIVSTIAQKDIFDQIAAQDTGNAERVVNQIAFGQTEQPQGPTIGAQPTAENAAAGANLAFPAEVQPLTMPLAKVLIAAHDKLRDVENFTQEGRAAHPIQAKLGDIADAIEGFLFGGAQQAQHNIGTGQ